MESVNCNNCGGIIADDDIETNHHDDDGESYTFEAVCPTCHKVWETNSWGECRSEDDKLEVLRDLMEDEKD